MIGMTPISWTGAPDTTQRHPLGLIANATDPYWGGAEFIYLQMPASQACKVGAVFSYDVATQFLAALMANTAILGKAAAIGINVVPSSASAQYAWCLISGQAPVWSSASVAANTAIGIVAAGQAGALAAGKQLNNARVTVAATTTVVKASTLTENGSVVIRPPNVDGWFPGLAITGTGIAASSVINSITGRDVTLNNAATATGSISAT